MYRPHQRAPRPLIRRDAEGHEQTGTSWESLVERLIREAQEEGRFDDLPGRGQRLHVDGDVHAGELALAHHLLRNARALPPWIETDKEVRRLHARIETLLDGAAHATPSAGLRLRQELESLAAAHDAAAARLGSMAPTARQHRPRLDRATLRRRLAAALGDDDARS